MIAGPILVTGAGGQTGFALAAALRDTWPDAALIGADSAGETAGAEFFDRLRTLPSADDLSYITALRALVRQTHARALIPLAHTELSRLFAEGLVGEEFGGAALVTANRQALAASLDRLAAARTLCGAGIAVAETGIAGEHEPGAGTPDYTCSIARFAQAATRTLIIRSDGYGEAHLRGEIDTDERLVRICARVADALALDGVIDVRLRMDADQPLIVELAPHLSSGLGLFHRLGFRGAVWSVQNRLGLPVGPYREPVAGTRIE